MQWGAVRSIENRKLMDEGWGDGWGMGWGKNGNFGLGAISAHGARTWKWLWKVIFLSFFKCYVFRKLRSSVSQIYQKFSDPRSFEVVSVNKTIKLRDGEGWCNKTIKLRDDEGWWGAVNFLTFFKCYVFRKLRPTVFQIYQKISDPRSFDVVKGQISKTTETRHVIPFRKPLEVSMLDSCWHCV